MKVKRKGKVHPSPQPPPPPPPPPPPVSFPSSSSSSSFHGDYLSVLKFLPIAIIALVSVLSVEDREVLAYMITRSMKISTSTSTSTVTSTATTAATKCSSYQVQDSKKKSSRMFDCDCFYCYTNYWFKWNSSENREIIHQAIEGFEDHLANGEAALKSKKNNRGKRKDKSRRVIDKQLEPPGQPEINTIDSNNVDTFSSANNMVDNETVSPIRCSPEECMAVAAAEDEVVIAGESIVRVAARSTHRGLARKVLPDVLGFFNSRLWNLWSTNV